MDTLSPLLPTTLSGEDSDGSLEADIRHLEAMIPQMVAMAQAAQGDAYARLLALHARIAQDIEAIRKSEACVLSSR